MGIKRTPADAAFSLCVREAYGWACARCGKQHEEKSQGLHASHHHGRGNWSVRFNPMNAEALCYGCHSLCGGTQQRLDDVLTQAEQALLRERKDDLGLGRLYRRTHGKGEIAKHYRNEHEKLRQKRADGARGRLTFDEWL